MDLFRAWSFKSNARRYNRGIIVIFGKEVRVLLKGQAKEAYLELKKRNDKEANSVLNSFNRIKEILKDNPQYGDPIQKELLKKHYDKIGIKNLYRIELSNYWRALYTIEGDVVQIFVIILNMVNHKDYNKLFGYKKR